MFYDPSPFKQCKACGQSFIKSKRNFYYSRGNRDHLSSVCKRCDNIGRLMRDKQKPELKKAREHRYRKTPKAKEIRDRFSKSPKGKECRRRNLISEKGKARQARYRNSERGILIGRIISRNHQIRRRKAEGAYTVDDVQRQRQKQRNLCFWCSEPVDLNFHVDHIIPISRYGTNWPANIVITCHSCNESKCDKLPFQEWQPRHCLGR